MKKFYFLFIGTLLFSFGAMAQGDNMTDAEKMAEKQSPAGEEVPMYNSKSVSAVTAFPFVETFEDGSETRADWTQIQEVGIYSWTFALGASNGSISTAYEGLLNARFGVGGFDGFKTKLVSPVMDLSGLSDVALSFYYGQELWSPDQNITTVFYRISATDPWVEIANYTNNVATWTLAELNLPNTSATYQLAFEGENYWGHTIVIDLVTVDGEGVPPPPPPAAPISNWAFMLIGVLAVTVVFFKFKK